MTVRRKTAAKKEEIAEQAVEEKETSPLRDILIRERHELYTWKETVEIRPPNLLVPRQIASHINALPLCKLAVTPKCDYVAVMSHRRTFQILRVLEGGELIPESNVQILEDNSAEYCLFEFSASGVVLLSTRSDASIDVFDRTGSHCYTIMPDVKESVADLVSAISSLSSYALQTAEENRFTDYLAVLHYNCALSAYKIGRTAYFKMFTVELTSPLTGVCRLLQSHNLLLVTTHYKVGSIECPGGLASYRLVSGSPHVVPVIAPKYEKDMWGFNSWKARLPFVAFDYISSLAVDTKESKAAGVSSTGDVFLFDLPSLTLLASLSHVAGPRPREIAFAHNQEIAILFSSGALVRCKPETEDFIAAAAQGDAAVDAEAFSPRTQMVTPTDRQLFLLESVGDPEAAISSQRSSLAARLFLLTIWRSLKQLLGMAAGDAAMPLQQATQLLSLDFTLWHAPTVTLEQLLERTMRAGNFEKARELVTLHPEIPSDTVYKRQWLDLCQAKKLAPGDVRDVLGRVEDATWKAERCLHTTYKSIQLQRELVSEGVRLSSNNEKALPLQLQAKLAHHGRLLAVMDDVELYLETRDQSLIRVAEGLAQRGELRPLEKLLCTNWKVVHGRALSILSLLPTAILPSRYARLLPNADGQLPACSPTEDDKASPYVAELARVREASREGRRIVAELDGVEEEMEEEESEEENALDAWAKQRARRIEQETGLVSYAMQLLEICEQRGCKTLSTDLSQWRQLDVFVRLTHNVNASLDFFLASSPSLLCQHFALLDETSLVSALPSIVALLEWHSPHSFLEPLAHLVTSKTENSTRVLCALQRTRPAMLSEQMLIQALHELTLTGPALMKALEGLNVPERIIKALTTLHRKSVFPTFGKLYESESDQARAKEVLGQLLHALTKTAEEWRRAADDVVELARLLYANLLSEDEALEMAAERFILDEDASCDRQALNMLLCLEGDKGDKGRETHNYGSRLPAEKSAQLLLRLSQSFVASSLSGKDAQMGRAKMLAEAAKGASPNNKEAERVLRSLDVIVLASELGSTRLPIHIVHADPVTLLEELVAFEDNYKRGKKCAKLAQLLRVDTPVATALARCALQALEKGDEATLGQYIQEVSSARQLAVVHTLCMRLLTTPNILNHMSGDIEACALTNAADDELEGVLEQIRQGSLEAANVEEQIKRSRSVSPLNPLKPRRELREGREKIVQNEEPRLLKNAPLDPFYTRVEEEESGLNVGDDREWADRMRRLAQPSTSAARHHNRSPAEAARILSAESATAAVIVGMLADEDEEWTADERLKRYASALRHFLPVLGPRLAEKAHPRRLIERAIAMNEHSTAMDRLDAYGCERDRFVGDVDYRLDTIDGLAMMEDERTWQDALELADRFAVPKERVHLSSLENILTSSSLSTVDARKLISSRGHRAVLFGEKEQTDKSCVALRRSVLPLVAERDEAYLLYLEQFPPSTKEALSLRILTYLRQTVKVRGLSGILTDESRLARIFEEVPEEDIGLVAGWIRKIPGTSSACEAAARSFISNRANPSRFIPLLSSPATLIELLGDVSVNLEADLTWLLSFSLQVLPKEYRKELEEFRKRRQELHREEIVREVARVEESDPYGADPATSSFFSFGTSNEGMVQRRKK